MNFLYKVTAEVNKGVNSLSSKIDGIGKSLTVKKDKYKTFMEMVIDYDYPIEKHFYTTEDGYINCVFRISGPLQRAGVLRCNCFGPSCVCQGRGKL